jgi:hypothetical protein
MHIMVFPLAWDHHHQVVIDAIHDWEQDMLSVVEREHDAEWASHLSDMGT